MGYRIKTVAEMLGIPRNTLLAWERRYGFICPPRQDNGYREYSEDDLIRLREVKRLIDDGHSISEAISLAQSAASPVENDRTRLWEALLAALLRMDREEAERVMRRGAGLSYVLRIDDVFFPLLREVGEGWARGEYTVAQEHYASAFCRDQMTAMLLSLDHGPAGGRLTLCAGWPEDQHDLGLMGLSVKLALRGHRVRFLGSRTPLDALCVAIGSLRPALVCVSCTLPQPRDEVIAYAQGMSDHLRECEAVIGGSGLPDGPLPVIPSVRWVRRSAELLG